MDVKLHHRLFYRLGWHILFSLASAGEECPTGFASKVNVSNHSGLNALQFLSAFGLHGNKFIGILERLGKSNTSLIDPDGKE